MAAMSDDSTKTVIAEGTEIEGSLRSRCDVTLSGRATGDLEAPRLVVTSQGSVSGSLRVERLQSDGEISGEVDADEVELAGKIADDTVIRAKHLQVKLSQPGGGLRATFGNCCLEVGERDGLADVDTEMQVPSEIDRPARADNSMSLVHVPRAVDDAEGSLDADDEHEGF